MTDSKPILNINEASKLCGLSPSVLRIWEVRYGWPSPKRKPNGYRAYNLAQVEELKRAAALVKAGTPISSLIIDGLPRWPASGPAAVGPLRLVQARTCVEATGPNELSQDLIEAFETRRGNRVIELLQRAIIALRPREEVSAVLIPALVALAEMTKAGRHVPEANEIRTQVRDRALQLLRTYRVGPEADWVVPANDDSHALAAVVALVLNQQGRPARYWSGTELPDQGRTLVVGDGDCTVCSSLGVMVGALPTIGTTQRPGVAELLLSKQPVMAD
jgi:DNA-binding transcriptional MerR regulator